VVELYKSPFKEIFFMPAQERLILRELEWKKPVPVDQLLFVQSSHPAYIRPNAQVVEIGPGLRKEDPTINLPMSAGPVILPYYLREGGSYDVIDLPGSDCSKQGGNHDAEGVREVIKSLYNEAGLPMSPFSVITADVLRFTPQKTYEIIFDHLTTDMFLRLQEVFVLDVLNKPPEPFPVYLGKQLKLLAPHGKLLFFKQTLIASSENAGIRFENFVNLYSGIFISFSRCC